MITYIVTEKLSNYESNGGHRVKRKLEKLSGLPCLVQFYGDVRLEKIKQLGIKAVIFSGYGTPMEERALESYKGVYELVREGDLPMIGFCGGHQLIAELYAPHNDKEITQMRNYPIRKLRKGEPDPNPGYHPGFSKEWGVYPISIVRDDKLFEGLDNQFMAFEYHRCEIKELPEDFILLASTKEVEVQAYRHKAKPIYGTQFHPENYTDYYPAGKKLIQNFFKIAEIL
jgi:GMP synthase (glutamine-hydrolysing)